MNPTRITQMSAMHSHLRTITARGTLRTAARTCCALVVIAATGCDPFFYSDLEDQAGVVVLESPDGYPRRGFGAVVLGFEATEADGTRVSRLVAGGDVDSPFIVYEGWDGKEPQLGRSLYDGCDDIGDCEMGAGAAFVGLNRWRAGTAAEGQVCVLVTATTSGAVIIRCENQAGTSETIMGPPAVRFGQSATGLPTGHAAGLALIGAPDAAGGAGRIYRLPDGSPPVELSLPEEVTPSGAKVGSTLTAGAFADGTAIVVAGAPGATRALVFALAADGSAEIRACLDGGGGYGGVVAMGDIDGDGAPEIAVASKVDAAGRAESVDVYPGSGLPTAAGCTAWGAAPTTVGCPEGRRGVDCTGAGFGAAVTIGDLDADGFGDLIIGAPMASVNGQSEAGAVFVVPGGASGLSPENADVLTHSSPSGGDRLGSVLGTFLTELAAGQTPRAEVAAGAPGADAVMIFMCSALDGDTPKRGERCVTHP